MITSEFTILSTFVCVIFSKCQKYTPNESNKTYEKAVTKKCGISFDPNLVVDALKNDMLSKKQTKTKEEYLKTYLEVLIVNILAKI